MIQEGYLYTSQIVDRIFSMEIPRHYFAMIYEASMWFHISIRNEMKNRVMISYVSYLLVIFVVPG